MASHDNFNNNENIHANQHAFPSSISLRDTFWIGFQRTLQKYPCFIDKLP